MTAKGPFAVSLIMPALNEEAGLEACVFNGFEGFERAGVRGEVVIVDDGSTDRTTEISRRLAASDERVRVVRHERCQGIGSSFWDGVSAARGEVVTFIPADGENDAFEILRYLPLLEEVDVVAPFVVNREVRPLARRFLSSLYVSIVAATTGVRLTYYNGTVLYRKSILSGITLRSRGFFYQTEILLKVLRRGYLHAEVPYLLSPRQGGKSKATTLKSLFDVARCYLATLGDLVRGTGLAHHPGEGSATFRRLARLNEEVAR